jgi:hypothetical protein
MFNEEFFNRIYKNKINNKNLKNDKNLISYKENKNLISYKEDKEEDKEDKNLISKEDKNLISYKEDKDWGKEDKDWGKEDKENNNLISCKDNEDELFWCFYICKYDLDNYKYEVKNQYFSIEKNEKFNYIKIISSKDKDILKILKENKIKKSHIIDDLANNKNINLNTLFTLCLIEKINLIYVDNNKYCEKIIDINKNINIIYKYKTNYLLELNINKEDDKINIIREDKIKLDLDNKLKKITNYKIDELRLMIKKLKIEIEIKKKKKNELYDILIKNI